MPEQDVMAAPKPIAQLVGVAVCRAFQEPADG